MARLIIVAAFAAILTASAAQANSFTANLCPGAGCPAGITEARLTFDEVLLGSDPNDYLVTIKIVGTAGAPQYLDSVQFAVSGMQTPADYEQKPTLQSAPALGSPWTVFFDQISGSPGDCSTDSYQGQGVCAQNTGNGISPIGTNIWTFNVDFVDDQGVLGAGSTVDLRAHFLQDGPHGIQNAGMMSPAGGGTLQQTTGDAATTNGLVPEPAMLSLFGVALTFAANRLRKAR